MVPKSGQWGYHDNPKRIVMGVQGGGGGGGGASPSRCYEVASFGLPPPPPPPPPHVMKWPVLGQNNYIWAKPLDFRASIGNKNSGKRPHPPPPPRRNWSRTPMIVRLIGLISTTMNNGHANGNDYDQPIKSNFQHFFNVLNHTIWYLSCHVNKVTFHYGIWNFNRIMELKEHVHGKI